MRKGLAILFAGAKGTAQCLYWIFAIEIATRYIFDYGGLHWSSCCSGSLFPWPHEPGPYQMIVRLNAIDEFIYHLIVSQMFIPVALGITAMAGFVGFLFGVYLERVKRRTRGNLKNR